MFKQLASGEPIEARLPYKDPITMTNYAKLLFNANVLPKEVENTEAFFRRFLVIPFEVVIPENAQDKELAKKIIACELPGFLNWMLQGTARVLKQKGLSDCQAAIRKLEEFKTNSDSVNLFLKEEEYVAMPNNTIPLKDLYADYSRYCDRDGYRRVSNNKFSERLRTLKFDI